jgi:carbon storage regulator
MLVLSRKTNELLHIGDDIVIKVLWTTRGRVRLGVEAPRAVPVRRSQVTVENRPPGPQLQLATRSDVTHPPLPAGIPVGDGFGKQRFAVIIRICTPCCRHDRR